MTNRQFDNDAHDELDDEQRDAELVYRGYARRKKDEKKGAAGPVPLAGGAGAGTGAATGAANPAAASAAGGAGLPSAPMGGAPMAVGGVALGASAAPEAAGSDVRFEIDQLSASYSPVVADDDPWGAYDNPEGIPGLELDEDREERERRGGGGLAMRASGTRGGSSGGGRMAPMMPMAAGGGAGAGAGAGAVAGGQMAVPGATVGGVGAASSMAVQQQQVAVQNAMAGAQQGSLPLGALNGMNAARATNAMTAPPASGVMAAGSGGLDVDAAALDETILRMGMDTNSPYVVGPDGNLYPNPHYTGDRGGSDIVAPGGGGVDGGSIGGGGVGGGVNPLPGNDVIRETQPISGGGGVGSGGFTPGPGNDVIRETQPYPRGGGTGPVGSGSSGSSNPGGVAGDVGGLKQDGFGGSAGSSPSAGTGSQGVATGGGWSTPAPSSGANPFTRSYGSSDSFAKGTNFKVAPEDLRREAREWERLAAEQEDLANQFKALPDPGPIFGVMENMTAPYTQVQTASTELAHDSGDEAEFASSTLDQSALGYDENEYYGVATAEGMNY